MLDIPKDFVPQLIAIDLDDTLVPHMGGVTERVVQSIERVRSAGITVVPATGRTVSTTAPIARAANLDDWMVCSNGAVLAAVEPEQILEAITFDPAPAITQLQELVPDATFAVEDIYGVFHTTHMFETGALGLSIREVPFEHLLADPVTRLVVRSEHHAAEGFDEVAKHLGLHSVVFGVADVAWMDVGPKGVNKATMLQRLCDELGIDQSKTLAIGDSDNDIEMLQWAGIGVAMGSARKHIKAVANTTTLAEPGDGVAAVLDSLVLS